MPPASAVRQSKSERQRGEEFSRSRAALAQPSGDANDLAPPETGSSRRCPVAPSFILSLTGAAGLDAPDGPGGGGEGARPVPAARQVGEPQVVLDEPSLRL